MIKERLPEIKERTGVEDIYLDGGYYGDDALEVAKENGVDLHYTNMTGKESDKVSLTEFEIEGLKTVKLCPGKHAPYSTSCIPIDHTVSTATSHQKSPLLS